VCRPLCPRLRPLDSTAVHFTDALRYGKPQGAPPFLRVIALSATPTDSSSATLSSDTMSVAYTLGLELDVLNAGTERDFDNIFANLIQLRAGGPRPLRHLV
jgi:hypothetical protein